MFHRFTDRDLSVHHSQLLVLTQDIHDINCPFMVNCDALLICTVHICFSAMQYAMIDWLTMGSKSNSADLVEHLEYTVKEALIKTRTRISFHWSSCPHFRNVGVES